MNNVSVTYFYRSCFAVGVGQTLLLFSYTRVDDSYKDAWISPADMAGFRHIIVFVPCASVEHVDRAAFAWPSYLPLDFVVASSAKHLAPERDNVHLIRRGETLRLEEAVVTACASVDDGVSFFVNVEGLNLYHAGDFNLWHWRDEQDSRKVQAAEQAFDQALSGLASGADLAFFPVDPRQGSLYAEGANRYMSRKQPRVLFPMHFAMNAEAINNFARIHAGRHTLVVPLLAPRASVRLDMSVDPPDVQAQALPEAAEVKQLLSAYMGDSPFASTDMPIRL